MNVRMDIWVASFLIFSIFILPQADGTIGPLAGLTLTSGNVVTGLGLAGIKLAIASSLLGILAKFKPEPQTTYTQQTIFRLPNGQGQSQVLEYTGRLPTPSLLESLTGDSGSLKAGGYSVQDIFGQLVTGGEVQGNTDQGLGGYAPQSITGQRLDGYVLHGGTSQGLGSYALIGNTGQELGSDVLTGGTGQRLGGYALQDGIGQGRGGYVPISNIGQGLGGDALKGSTGQGLGSYALIGNTNQGLGSDVLKGSTGQGLGSYGFQGSTGQRSVGYSLHGSTGQGLDNYSRQELEKYAVKSSIEQGLGNSALQDSIGQELDNYALLKSIGQRQDSATQGLNFLKSLGSTSKQLSGYGSQTSIDKKLSAYASHKSTSSVPNDFELKGISDQQKEVNLRTTTKHSIKKRGVEKERQLSDFLKLIQENDVYQCVNRLLCDMAAGPLRFGQYGQSVTDFFLSLDEDNGEVGLARDYRKAAVLGQSSQDTRKCEEQYNCPEDIWNMALFGDVFN